MFDSKLDRRQLLQLSTTAAVTLGSAFSTEQLANATQSVDGQNPEVIPNMIGAYGPWASSISSEELPRLSFRRNEFQDLDKWRSLALSRVQECLLPPARPTISDVQVEFEEQLDGLKIEHLSWQLPYGPRTRALLLKPEEFRGKLPAILGLHDHGGMKYFGHEKITKTNADQHPIIVQHQADDYGGLAWANEIAKRGYVVLVHDTFTFGSRRVLTTNLPNILTRNLPNVLGDSADAVKAYNDFAGEHEHIMAKGLFCAGLTWPGVFINEDQAALDYLCSRSEVDTERVGCAGLSGGGLRTTYLAGLDPRISCACCVGMMTTWRDYLLHKSYIHTWMIYIPGLPRDLDYPEILALRAPKPTLVLNNNDDPLFTLPEMKRADEMMKEIFKKSDAADAYRCSFYPGLHKFDREMQNEAWEWFDHWLT